MSSRSFAASVWGWRRREDREDLPWSMWAIRQMLRMRKGEGEEVKGRRGERGGEEGLEEKRRDDLERDALVSFITLCIARQLKDGSVRK